MTHYKHYQSPSVWNPCAANLLPEVPVFTQASMDRLRIQTQNAPPNMNHCHPEPYIDCEDQEPDNSYWPFRPPQSAARGYSNYPIQNSRFKLHTAAAPVHPASAALPEDVQFRPADASVIASPPQRAVEYQEFASPAPPRIASNLERSTLAALNRIFPGRAFIKIRPPWLRNPRSGRACELDFYCDELKLGVEVQGMQHYVYPNSWHKSRAEWEDQLYRDQLKQHLCKELGITLVHVPFTVPHKHVEDFIRQETQRVAVIPELAKC
jgi:hypothetical protein